MFALLEEPDPFRLADNTTFSKETPGVVAVNEKVLVLGVPFKEAVVHDEAPTEPPPVNGSAEPAKAGSTVPTAEFVKLYVSNAACAGAINAARATINPKTLIISQTPLWKTRNNPQFRPKAPASDLQAILGEILSIHHPYVNKPANFLLTFFLFFSVKQLQEDARNLKKLMFSLFICGKGFPPGNFGFFFESLTNSYEAVS